MAYMEIAPPDSSVEPRKRALLDLNVEGRAVRAYKTVTFIEQSWPLIIVIGFIYMVQ